MHRKHLSPSSQAVLASGGLANLRNGFNRHEAKILGRQICLPTVTQDEAAKLMNVSVRTVKEVGLPKGIDLAKIPVMPMIPKPLRPNRGRRCRHLPG